jgi:hypothetical protein
MGPVALFDKSFLQSLSVDEAVWFDHFYIANISPLFYVETLADLDKEMRRGRTPEQVVGEIATKSPEMQGYPNVHHSELLLADLFGQHISMTMRPVIAGGKSVKSGSKRGVNFDVSPEQRAFGRWQDGKYSELEREFARSWRAKLELLSFDNSEPEMLKLGIDVKACKNLDQAYEAADKVVSAASKPYDLLGFICRTFGLPRQYHQDLVRRYQLAGLPSLARYAPYAAHLAKVEILFHVSVARAFISPDRPSNKVDIAYLYYLPFCNVFISGDKLHKNAAEYFLMKGQRFVWAPDLKADLRRLNEYYLLLPEAERDRGIISFADRPPSEDNFLTADLWDLIDTRWRTQWGENIAPLSKEGNDKLVEHLKGFTEAPTLPPGTPPLPDDDLDCLSFQRAVRRKRGSWYQVPRDIQIG